MDARDLDQDALDHFTFFNAGNLGTLAAGIDPQDCDTRS
jgi:hypothetical protein